MVAKVGQRPAAASGRARWPRFSLPWLFLERPAISHRPDPHLTGLVLVTDPWRIADVQIGVRRAVEHLPRAGISNRVRKPAAVRIERPQDHPVRTNRNRRTRSVERIGVA